jgi:S-adenosylmethionine:tRNA ribosyltransferase-isomerase
VKERRPPLIDRHVAQPATHPPEARGLARDEVRLLVSRGHGHEHAVFHELADFLPAGALLVVNTSATLPASLPASARFGTFILNLSTRYADRLWLAEPRWSAARPGPLPLAAGEIFEAAGMSARLVAPYPALPRLWFVAFDGSVEMAMADEGEPIRYGYVEPPFPPLSAYQTIFAERPGSAEMPSAARPFSQRVLDELAWRNMTVAPVELQTGVSSLEVGDGAAGRALYPEPFAVPAETAAAVNSARRDGRAVIAVGTTVVRALESAFDGTRVRAANGFTRLFVDPRRGVSTVDGLITGFHDPHATHLAMLHAIAGETRIAAAYDEAAREGYLSHEFGDSHLILRNSEARSAT